MSFSSPTPRKRGQPEPSSPKPKPPNQPSPSSSKPKSRRIVKKPSCVIMEFSSKQSSLFMTRAFALKEALEDKVPDIIFDMNPQKTRKGCFEIRNDKGEIYVSLLNLKDPYDELMALDLKKLAEEISNKIAGPDNQQ